MLCVDYVRERLLKMPEPIKHVERSVRLWVESAAWSVTINRDTTIWLIGMVYPLNVIGMKEACHAFVMAC